MRSIAEHTEHGCAAVAAELALPSTACVQIPSPQQSDAPTAPLARRPAAVLETDER